MHFCGRWTSFYMPVLYIPLPPTPSATSPPFAWPRNRWEGVSHPKTLSILWRDESSRMNQIRWIRGGWLMIPKSGFREIRAVWGVKKRNSTAQHPPRRFLMFLLGFFRRVAIWLSIDGLTFTHKHNQKKFLYDLKTLFPWLFGLNGSFKIFGERWSRVSPLKRLSLGLWGIATNPGFISSYNLVNKWRYCTVKSNNGWSLGSHTDGGVGNAYRRWSACPR